MDLLKYFFAKTVSINWRENKMTSENEIESNTNDEKQNNELYQKDIETNIDYETWYKKESGN